MKPLGWFQIVWPTDFLEGEVVTKRFFGEDLVVFRVDGELRALDAYCGHMGAHLGCGGVVRDGNLVCPFHGWEWSKGRSQRLDPLPGSAQPLGTDPPVAGRREERCGVPFAPLGGNGSDLGGADLFEVLAPSVAGRALHPAHPDGEIRFGPRSLDPYVVLDNAADPAHFVTVHRTHDIPIVVESEADAHRFRVKLGFGKSWILRPDDATGAALDIVEVGVGLSYTALGGRQDPYAVILLATSPIDDHTSEVFQTVWLEKAAGDDQPGGWPSGSTSPPTSYPRHRDLGEPAICRAPGLGRKRGSWLHRAAPLGCRVLCRDPGRRSRCSG